MVWFEFPGPWSALFIPDRCASSRLFWWFLTADLKLCSVNLDETFVNYVFHQCQTSDLKQVCCRFNFYKKSFLIAPQWNQCACFHCILSVCENENCKVSLKSGAPWVFALCWLRSLRAPVQCLWFVSECCGREVEAVSCADMIRSVLLLSTVNPPTAVRLWS